MLAIFAILVIACHFMNDFLVPVFDVLSNLIINNENL